MFVCVQRGEYLAPERSLPLHCGLIFIKATHSLLNTAVYVFRAPCKHLILLSVVELPACIWA